MSVYKNQWKGWADWLGTKPSFLPFDEAREIAQEITKKLRITNMAKWVDVYRDGKIPENIPRYPNIHYKLDWRGWPFWGGDNYAQPIMTLTRIKFLITHLVTSNILQDWSGAELTGVLYRSGALKTEGAHLDFFHDMVKAIKTSGGMKAVVDYGKSNDKDLPDLTQWVNEAEERDEKIRALCDEGDYYNDKNAEKLLPTKYSPTVKDILFKIQTVLEIGNSDSDAMEFYIARAVTRLWIMVFEKEDETLDDIKKNTKTGNEFQDLVIDTFLLEYQNTKNMVIPKEYTSKHTPFLSQRYVAYKIKTKSYLGDFSGTGAGKTLSAVLASRVINSKITLVICTKDIISHWKENIKEIFPDSKIITGNAVFDVKYDSNVCQYLILNYDKLNQKYSKSQLLKLSHQKIDFVILDEIHFSKITTNNNISLRRKNLEVLLLNVRKLNSEIKTLGLSATPVVNNLNEGKSILELITGIKHNNITTKSNLPNAIALFEKLSVMSIRQIPNYPSSEKIFKNIDVGKLSNEQIKSLTATTSPLYIEQILTDYRLPHIIDRIDGQTIIYTEYVSDIIDKISNAVKKAGFKVGFYFGDDHSGLELFKEKKVQVLIASKPISRGLDGLQEICHNLIYNTIPWTNAQYEQMNGRIVRRGQKNKVTIYHFMVSITGYPYDQNKMRRIEFKKSLSDCAMDGVLSKKDVPGNEEAARGLILWLERLAKKDKKTILPNIV